MLLINFLCWLLTVVDVDAVHRGVGLEICTQARCKPDGPAIRFPFQLKGKQSIHCGYHGFDMSCTNQCFQRHASDAPERGGRKTPEAVAYFASCTFSAGKA
ncbi:hypothetical protein CerSpe_071680 [Prunus speciosa]